MCDEIIQNPVNNCIIDVNNKNNKNLTTTASVVTSPHRVETVEADKQNELDAQIVKQADKESNTPHATERQQGNQLILSTNGLSDKGGKKGGMNKVQGINQKGSGETVVTLLKTGKHPPRRSPRLLALHQTQGSPYYGKKTKILKKKTF